jgi:hypothetical protein
MGNKMKKAVIIFVMLTLGSFGIMTGYHYAWLIEASSPENVDMQRFQLLSSLYGLTGIALIVAAIVFSIYLLVRFLWKFRQQSSKQGKS